MTTEHYFSERPTSKIKFYKIETTIRGIYFEFLTASSTFSYRRIDLGTRLLAEKMLLPEKGMLLDIGCGYGVVGIVAAKINPNLRVIMTDINKRAVMLAKENLKLNNIRNAEVRHGFLYEPVRGLKFDAIVSNPPISAGIEKVIKPLIFQAREYLTENGCLQLVVKSRKGGYKIHELMKEAFNNISVIDRKSGYRILASFLEADKSKV